MENGRREYDLEIFREFIDKEDWDAFQQKAWTFLEDLQQESFLDGYRYAITLLEENLVKKNKD